MSRIWRLLGRGLFWLTWPALYVYLRQGARTRVYIIAEGQILLVKGWLSDGNWILPGGGLHRGESPAVGATREVDEETGIILEPSALVPIKSEWRKSRGLKSYLHFFAATLPQPANLRLQRGEILAARWFRLDELSDESFKTEVQQAVRLLAGRG